MWKQTAKVIKDLVSEKYKVAWFVDFTEAFNKIHQPLLVDELKRRYKAL